MMNLTLLIALLCLCIINHCNAVYMIVTPISRCFTFEKPDNTPITFFYEVLDANHIVQLSLYYGKDPNTEMTILNQDLHDSSGSVKYVTDIDGIHTWCLNQKLKLNTDPNAHAPPSRVKMHISYGYDSEYYERVASENNFDAVNMDVRKINDMMDLALNEADFQKYKEIEYHDETESNNNAMLWWPIAQIGILILIGIFQVRHLKNFFKINKLI
jgi:hypothetical protein